MKIYNTQAEVDKDIVDGVLSISGNVTFNFNLKMEADLIVETGDIKARKIKARDIEAWNIEARNIKAEDIEARNIKAGDIEAWNIEAEDIEAGNIEARNIKAGNIEARNIKARDISFWAVAYARLSFSCKSITGRRDNSKYFCLDSEVVFSKEEAV